jgi:hypothetical protein
VIAEAYDSYGERFGFMRVDFPLESECNPSLLVGRGRGLHPAACEAAAAVRFTRNEAPSREEELIAWLWSNQEKLTREMIFQRLTQEFELDLTPRYQDLVASIALEAAEGRKLRVSGTPTFFLNGRRLPPVSATALTAAIAYEMAELRRVREGKD